MKLLTIVLIVEICGSIVDLRCSSASISPFTTDTTSTKPFDVPTIAMSEDQKKIVVFPKSDKKFTVQLQKKIVMTTSQSKNMEAGIRRNLQKNIISMKEKHFTVEQTTRHSIPSIQTKRSRLMKKFDEILRSRESEKDKNKQEFDNLKEMISVKDISSERNSSSRTQLQEIDIPVATPDVKNKSVNRRVRETEKENVRYSIDDVKRAVDVDAGEREDREEFLFIDGDDEGSYSDGPIKINLLDGIIGQLGNFYEETESVTEVDLDNAEEDIRKRYVVEEENVLSTSAPQSTDVNMDSAIAYDMTYKNIN